MKFLDLMNIAEQHIDLVNPTTPAKILTVGRALGLTPGHSVIDFGCGYGAVLALWSQHYGISGLGIDIRPHACARAEQTLQARGHADRVQIVCHNAADYAFVPHTYDVAACIGATFIWNTFSECLRRLKRAARPNGHIVVGELYWRTPTVPPEFARDKPNIHTEAELLDLARAESLDLTYLVRSSQDDWDHYQSENWRGLTDWLHANPDHPERAAVLTHLRQTQDEYLRYGRHHYGWAIYIYTPSLDHPTPFSP
jgi:SAM-dependent methyltransferase